MIEIGEVLEGTLVCGGATGTCTLAAATEGNCCYDLLESSTATHAACAGGPMVSPVDCSDAGGVTASPAVCQNSGLCDFP